MVADARTQFHILAFEGPDPYARVGGLASRVSGLARTLADLRYPTHLWFVGDPALPGHEERGGVFLHRWCQWISRHHAAGVYDGEDGKQADYGRSLPPFLLSHLVPHLVAGGSAVVLAEEWQTAGAVLHLDWLLRCMGLRRRAAILWNANNVFGFERLDWPRLREAAVVTTVSRYMRQRLAPLGVDALVIPNGLERDAFEPPDFLASARLRSALGQRLLLAKVARFDPDKRWLAAMEIVAALKRRGERPLLVARGGAEPHGQEVLARARQLGLRVTACRQQQGGPAALVDAVGAGADADVVSLATPLDPAGRRLLFREVSVVLANSSHEPFGLVGLETMAAAGVACTGCTGEDYVQPNRNALVLQTGDPHEFVGLFAELRRHPEREQALRRAGRATAETYAWPDVVRAGLLPRLELLGAAV